MKQSLTSLLVVALLVTTSSQAQVWCPPGAQWSHVNLLVEGDGVYETMVERYVGDTLIAGQSAQHIKQYRYLAEQDAGEPALNMVTDQYTRHDGDLVLTWNAQVGTFDTLFWFGAEVGDIWPAFAPGLVGGPGQFRVLDKTLVNLGGLSLRRLEVSIEVPMEDFTYQLDVDTLYERIGLMHSNFLYRSSLDYAFPVRMCYQDDVFSWSKTGTMDNCDLTLAVPSRDQVLGSGIYPNPATANIRLEGLQTNSRGILVFRDATGRECLLREVQSEMVTVDVSALKPGLYLVSLRGAGSQKPLRFVKE